MHEKNRPENKSKYKNASLPIDERVQDLLQRMSLEEKVAQMLGVWNEKDFRVLNKDKKVDYKVLREHLNNGVGHIGRLSDTAGGQGPKEMAEMANIIQKFFVEETRLGIPVIFHEECLHGLAGPEATSYPQPIGLAATFNPELIEEIYTAIAQDARMRGAQQALTPVVDVARDPRWGRVEETFGEDPYLVAQLGIAAVKGFQGDATFKDKKRVIATLKHFAAHGQPESGTNCAPVNVSERLLRDTFLYTFKEAIDKGKAMSVMASYNEIDGVSSHANKWLLRDVLRKEWGFAGTVVSDYYAIKELNIRPEAISHCHAKDKSEAALLAATAGVNIELPEMDCYPNLVQLVNDKKLDISVIDELVTALLKHKFQVGIFDDPYVDPELIENDEKLEQDRQLALRAAHETITLLKNENELLPLNSKKMNTLAVIGPNADRQMIGGYSGTPKYNTTVLEGIKAKLGGDVNVLYSEGCKITVGGSWQEDVVTASDPDEDKKSIQEAVKVAEQADMVVLAIGGNEQTSREGWDIGHLGDRASLELFGMQNELVQAIVNTGKPIVAVLFNGRPLSITHLNNNVPAILECWYLGQECGNAIADVLFGDYNPAGKLPISIPRSVGHIPCYYNYKPSARRGYLHNDVSALFPFGFGLSYTRFSLTNLRLEKSTITKDGSTKALIDIKNTGSIVGTEVVQLYIRDLFSTVTRPVKELKGIKKITLQPGELKIVELPIGPDQLAYTNIDKKWVVEPGDFEIMVGTSSQDQDLTKITLTVE